MNSLHCSISPISINEYGAIPGIGGMKATSEALSQALIKEKNIYIPYHPDGYYISEVGYYKIVENEEGEQVREYDPVNGVTITGEELIVPPNKYGMHIYGNDNIIKIKKFRGQKPLANDSVKTEINYKKEALRVQGDRNEISNVVFTDISSFGLVIGGKNNSITNVHSYANQGGMRLLSNCRHINIIGGSFSHNRVVSATAEYISGSDGILCHRNASYINITGVELSGNSEHGVYAQGNHITITNCTARGNLQCGIKYGSYSTQLDYDNDDGDEKPELGIEFLGKNLKIINCITSNNINSGVYIQPRLDGLIISGLYSSNDRIFFAVLNKELTSDGLFNVTISDCQLTGDPTKAVMLLNFDAGKPIATIRNTTVAGLVQVYSSNRGTTTTSDILFDGITCPTLLPTRVSSLFIRNSHIGNLRNVTTANGIELENSVLHSQTEPLSRVTSMKGVTVNYSGKDALSLSGSSHRPIRYMRDCNIICTSLSEDYAFKAGNIDGLDWSDSALTINVDKAIECKGTYGRLNNISIKNQGISETSPVIDITGTDISVTGCTISLGAIHLRGKNNLAVGNLARVTVDSVADNVLSGNLLKDSTTNTP